MQQCTMLCSLRYKSNSSATNWGPLSVTISVGRPCTGKQDFMCLMMTAAVVLFKMKTSGHQEHESTKTRSDSRWGKTPQRSTCNTVHGCEGISVMVSGCGMTGRTGLDRKYRNGSNVQHLCQFLATIPFHAIAVSFERSVGGLRVPVAGW